jgi:hypothetical protein
MVNAEGEIRRIRPGAGTYAVDQGESVEVGVQLQAAQFQAPFAVMDQTNATALRARLGETKAEFFTDVEVNGAADVSGIFSAGQLRSEGIVQVCVNPPAGATVAVDGTLRATGNISTTAALRADGVEPLTGSTLNVAGALSATEPVTVTGPTNPPSHLFAGTLVLGKWRIRGNEAGAIYVERFDDDGAIVSDAWLNVASFVHNADNNVPGLDVANLGVPGTATVGTMAVTGDLTTAGTTRCDVFKGRQAAQVTCQDNLTVTGSTSLQDLGVQGTVELGQLRLHHDTTAVIVERLSGGAWERAATIGHDDTLGGAIVTDNLAVDGTATVNNLQIGGSLTGWTPFWCAGKIAANASVLTSVGAYGFSVVNTSVGQYKITYDVPHPLADCIVQIAGHGYIYLSAANSTHFSVVCKRFDFALANMDLHFSVLRP